MSFPCLSIPEDSYTAIGLMSGTSLDGVDAAVLVTDGQGQTETGAFLSLAYEEGLRDALRALLGTRRGERSEEVAEAEAALSACHGEAVEKLMGQAGLTSDQIDVVGFHGQTLFHAPGESITYQIGDGAGLAKRLGINVVADFRSNDVAHGGQGAPLACLYHAALAKDLEKPLCVLNMGGVANVTWLGEGEAQILAFDCGPANAHLDDWVRERAGEPFDRNGALARQGKVDEAALKRLLAHPYFGQMPPKSLDRNEFDISALANLAPADGAATLSAFTVRAAAMALKYFPQAPKRWLVCGGGRHNGFLMEELARALSEAGGQPVGVEGVEAAGWNGDALEAQAFAYLAVRSLKNFSLSLPSTTGVAAPLSGGVLFKA